MHTLSLEQVIKQLTHLDVELVQATFTQDLGNNPYKLFHENNLVMFDIDKRVAHLPAIYKHKGMDQELRATLKQFQKIMSDGTKYGISMPDTVTGYVAEGIISRDSNNWPLLARHLRYQKKDSAGEYIMPNNLSEITDLVKKSHSS